MALFFLVSAGVGLYGGWLAVSAEYETRAGNTTAAEQDILLEEQTSQSAGKKVSRDAITKWVSKAEWAATVD